MQRRRVHDERWTSRAEAERIYAQPAGVNRPAEAVPMGLPVTPGGATAGAGGGSSLGRRTTGSVPMGQPVLSGTPSVVVGTPVPLHSQQLVASRAQTPQGATPAEGHAWA